MSRRRMPKPGKLLVAEKRCRECLMTKNRIVSEKRADQLIEKCRADGTYFVCHKGSLTGNDQLCCRGFYDQIPTVTIRLAQALGIVKFVPIPDADPMTTTLRKKP